MDKNSGMPIYLRTDPDPDEHGVLLRNRIKCYAKAGMICPFEEDKLKSAGYYLSIGDEYYLGGVRYRLQCDRDSITIPPYEVAIIKTEEYLQIPWFLIARWNIRVSRAYDGLLWVGAAQVDPGYEGHLSCPIYNLSNRSIQLFRGDSIALIDFVKTTKSCTNGDEIKTIKHTFGDFGKHLESGLLSNREQVEDLRNRVDAADTRIWIFATLVIGMIGVVVALMTNTALSPGMSTSLRNDWILPVAVGMSFASGSLAVLWVAGLIFGPFYKNLEKFVSLRTLLPEMMYRRLTVCAGVFLSALFVAVAYWIYDSGIGALREEQRLQHKETEYRYDELNQRIRHLEGLEE